MSPIEQHPRSNTIGDPIQLQELQCELPVLNANTVERPLTMASSTATLCGLTDSEDDKAKESDPLENIPTTIPEHPPKPSRQRSYTTTNAQPATITTPSIQRSNTATNRQRSSTIVQPTRKVSQRRYDNDRPPPIPAPGDVISVFDPASAGGGGPLKRIETARSERYEQENRERAEREAQGLPPEGNGILRRFRSHSNTSKRRPTFVTPLPSHPTHDEEDGGHSDEIHTSNYRFKKHQPTLSPTHSRKSSFVNTPATTSNDDNEKRDGYFPSDPEDTEMQVQLSDFEDHVYPDGGYGWVVLVCCVTLAGCTMGWGMNYGVFQEYYSTNVFPGQSTALILLPGALNGFFMNCSAFLSGRTGDRYGFKRVLFASAFIFWLGLFLASFSTKLWQLILTQGIIAGFGQGLAMPLFMSLPSQWFYKKRGLASGIAIGGAGIGGGTITLVARQLLTTVGHKKTLLILSFIELFFMLIAVVFIRTRPTSPEARSGKTAPWVDKEVVKTGAFWSIFFGTIVGTIGYGMPFNMLAQYVKVKFPEIDPILIALPVTLLAYMVCVGRALVGFVADRIGPLNTYILVFFVSGIIQLCLWLTATSFGAVLAFAIIFGLIAPGFSGILPQIIVQLFGPANLATNVGLLLLSGAPGNLINGPIGGGIYDATGKTTFKYTIIFGGSMQILGGLLASYARYKTSKKFLVKV
ncbi:uncharacterized protein IL334_000210 [Kwoniella shivajii]|uniref:Major facilitator superfamily (MFS) profile domain-containing protein n=1 Tax=Kwoniella shivajii TaxID=564305 RepID=A0ABZ1CQ24_9TREE|nr:hypothetical protein IL334_000210 [Kwoniella shivajii]